MREVVVAGHICLDLVPSLPASVALDPGTLLEIGPIAFRPGGCVANTGGDLAGLGAPTRLVADIGDDELGGVLLRLLSERGDDISCLTQVPGASTSYSVVVQPTGRDRMFWHHVGANAHFDGRRVDLLSGDLLHLGYPPVLPLMLRDHGALLRDLLDRAKRRGFTTSVDLAVVHPDSGAGQADWSRIMRLTLPYVDLLTPSIDDLASILHRPFARSVQGLSAVAGEILAQGVAVVAVTAGRNGLLLRTADARRLSRAGRVLAPLADEWADREVWVAAPPVEIVSTTGAGDAATAGLLYALLAGQRPEEAAGLAAFAGALRVRTSSRLPPYGDGTPYTLESVSRYDLMLPMPPGAR